MKFTLTTGIFIFFLTFVGCKKTAAEFNPNLVGTWVSKNDCRDIITIDSNGFGSYSVIGFLGDCKSGERSKGLTKCDGNLLKIGTTKFYIKSMPKKIDTVSVYVSYGQKNISVESMVLKKNYLDGGYSITLYKAI